MLHSRLSCIENYLCFRHLYLILCVFWLKFVAIKTQAPSASVTGTPLVSMAAATHPSTFSQSIQLQSTSQYQQPIQLPSISQSNNSLPSVVGSTTTSRQITPLAPLTNVASSSQFLPKTGHTTTQWMNLSTLGGPPIGQANLSTERLPVLTSSDAGGGIMGSTQQPLPVNAGGGDNRSNGGVISSAVGQGSTSARSNSQASIMATSQNGTPGVVASTPASATVGADASSASAPVVASSKNQVEPTLAESAVQSSPRRPTRGKSKADEPSADSTPAASLTSPEPHPSTRSEMSTRRGTIAAPQASAIQPLPKSSPAAATRSGASSTTMTSPPTGSGTKRANEVVGKNSTADASDNVRRSKRISQ